MLFHSPTKYRDKLRPANQEYENNSYVEKESSRINFAKTRMFVIHHFDQNTDPSKPCNEGTYYTTMKTCESNSNPNYSISGAHVDFTLFEGVELWDGWQELPSKNVSIGPREFWEKTGRICVIFPSELRRKIGGPYKYAQKYITYKT
jgi:hypothetical protein